MQCPDCGTEEWAGFNGFVLCVPTAKGSVPHRLTNDQYNALVEDDEFEDEPVVVAPKRVRKAPKKKEDEPELDENGVPLVLG